MKFLFVFLTPKMGHEEEKIEKHWPNQFPDVTYMIDCEQIGIIQEKDKQLFM